LQFVNPQCLLTHIWVERAGVTLASLAPRGQRAKFVVD